MKEVRKKGLNDKKRVFDMVIFGTFQVMSPPFWKAFFTPSKSPSLAASKSCSEVSTFIPSNPSSQNPAELSDCP